MVVSVRWIGRGGMNLRVGRPLKVLISTAYWSPWRKKRDGNTLSPTRRIRARRLTRSHESTQTSRSKSFLNYFLTNIERMYKFKAPGPCVYEQVPTALPKRCVWVKLREGIVCYAPPPVRIVKLFALLLLPPGLLPSHVGDDCHASLHPLTPLLSTWTDRFWQHGCWCQERWYVLPTVFTKSVIKSSSTLCLYFAFPSPLALHPNILD